MSEAELYLIRQRMLSGRLAKAERGELAVPLPIGYVRRPSGEAAFDPDEQAQHVVRLVFSTFSRIGTVNGVLRYLVGQEIQLPVRVHAGPAKGELEWRRPTRETLQNMLHNPVYAGYFAWGRRQVDQRRKAPGRPSTGRVVKDSTEWLVLLPGRLPAYITEEHYAANAARMAANQQTAVTPGPPRDGAALLSGLLRCGRCGGHRMSVRYPDGNGTGRARSARLRVLVLPGQLRDRRGMPARLRAGARRLRRQPGPASGGAGRAGGLHGRGVPGRGRARHAQQALAAAGGARPLRRRPRPPPVPAGRAREQARHPAAGIRLGSRPRRDRPAGSGLPSTTSP